MARLMPSKLNHGKASDSLPYDTIFLAEWRPADLHVDLPSAVECALRAISWINKFYVCDARFCFLISFTVAVLPWRPFKREPAKFTFPEVRKDAKCRLVDIPTE